MTYTYDENIYSDLHKDAYGFRPRSGRFYADDATPDEKQAIWDRTLADLDEAIAEEKAAEIKAVAEFEALVAKTMTDHNISRLSAIRWLMDAEDDPYMTDDYFRWNYRLPYFYDFYKGEK